MAQKKSKRIKLKGKISGKYVVAILALMVGLPFATTAALNQTAIRNYAANPSLGKAAVTNINTANQITGTTNPDGTMGPLSAFGNTAQSLPAAAKGKLKIKIIDSDSKNKGNKGSNGPQTITSLLLTLSKAEVHMVQGNAPKEKSGKQTGKPSQTPAQRGVQVDKWETLSVTNPTTVDLVQFRQTEALFQLGMTELAPGRYNELRLYVSGANAKLANGTTVPLQILGNDKIVRVVRSFTIVEGQDTEVTIDIDAKKSVAKAGDIYLLKPVVARFQTTK